MEKKKGNICIVNKALFTKDKNHPAGYTIPVNTRLIINIITEKYFWCTLDTGYNIGIELEHDCSLTIITDNKKINKFKQQLAENNSMQNINFETCELSVLKDFIENLEFGELSEEGNIALESAKAIHKKRSCDIDLNKLQASPKTVLKRKVWTVEVLEMSDGTSIMNRNNDGFNINELMGLSSLLSYELLEQYKGHFKADIINRTVVVD